MEKVTDLITYVREVDAQWKDAILSDLGLAREQLRARDGLDKEVLTGASLGEAIIKATEDLLLQHPYMLLTGDWRVVKDSATQRITKGFSPPPKYYGLFREATGFVYERVGGLMLPYLEVVGADGSIKPSDRVAMAAGFDPPTWQRNTLDWPTEWRSISNGLQGASRAERFHLWALLCRRRSHYDQPTLHFAVDIIQLPSWQLKLVNEAIFGNQLLKRYEPDTPKQRHW